MVVRQLHPNRRPRSGESGYNSSAFSCLTHVVVLFRFLRDVAPLKKDEDEKEKENVFLAALS